MISRARCDIARVQAIERGMQARPGVGLVEHMAVAQGGDRKAVRHADALSRQLAVHLAERGVLAADQRHVANAQILEPADVVAL
jgi:hypothetical protein